MYDTKLCHKHVTLTDILAASTNIKSRDFSTKYSITQTNLLQGNSTDKVADIDNVLLHDDYYQPPIFLDRVVRYIGDIGILVRIVGLHPIEFIELKNSLCQEPVLKDSWRSLYCISPVVSLDGDDVSFDVKVITLRIIYSIMQMCLRGIRLTSPGEYHIEYNAAARIFTIVGWKTMQLNSIILDDNITLIESIINFAVKGLIPENIKIIVDQSSRVMGAKYIKIPMHNIFTTMPDMHLLSDVVHYSNSGYRLIKNICIRDFITIQLDPYDVNFHGVSRTNYKQYIQNRLSNIIKKIHHHQDLHNCILMDIKQTEYDVDTWYKHVINNFGNLSYKGNKVLNLETIADNTELYNRLISLISADKFLEHMAEHAVKFFYNLLDDGIQVLTEIEEIKHDMFIAFASAHMTDILTRCGAVLTEDVFHTVFGIKPIHHHLRLLHRGILLRDNLMLLYQQSITNLDINNSNKSWVRSHPQEIRMSQQVALELLCTYFQGLDKIVKIKPLATKWLPGGAFNLNYKRTKLNFTNKISLIEYPLPLRVSFIDSIYDSTDVLLNLQKFLSKHKYIGIKGVQLSGPINLDFNSLTEYDLKIFQYFTGYEDVVDFEEWVNKLLTPPIKDNRLSTLLGLAETKDVQKQFMLIMIAMSVSNRDFTLLRREPYQLIKTGFKQVLFPTFDSDIFNKLHDYAQLMSSFVQYDNREKEVLDEVQINLHNTYTNIISDNDVLFEVNMMSSNLVSARHQDYNIVSDALLDNTKEMLLRDTPKTILDGKMIQVIPYIINTITSFTNRTAYSDAISYTKFYKLSTSYISTTSNQQSSSSAEDTVTIPSKRASIDPYNDGTTSSKKSRKKQPRKKQPRKKQPRKKSRVISPSHISSAESVTISSKLCNSTLHDSSCKLLHTTISPVLERDKNYIVSLSSETNETNNITSEESNNSNHMGEQSGVMLSVRANKKCPIEYQQGYDFSTQEIYKNPIIDEEYRCVNNHGSENIDLPSTANLIQEDLQTAVYNCQNEGNTFPTVERIQDDWLQNLCTFQNDDDILIDDIPIDDIPIDDILIDDIPIDDIPIDDIPIDDIPIDDRMQKSMNV